MRVHQYNKPKRSYRYYVLGADIGGTNTALCIAGVSQKPELLFSFHFKTRNLRSIIPALKQVLDYAWKRGNIKVSAICLGAAGPVKGDKVKLFNASLSISATEIRKKTGIKRIALINDFQLVGYGLSMLTPKDYLIAQKGKAMTKAPIAILGAGSGLGTTRLRYDKSKQGYIPLPQEDGHALFPVEHTSTKPLVRFIEKQKSRKVEYEDLVSGKGLENIYAYLKSTNKFSITPVTKKIDHAHSKAIIISKYRKKDQTCKEVFRLFTKFYAQAARNYAVKTMAQGGVYIAGGIAAKNKDIFKTRIFKQEFLNVNSAWLKKIPIKVILDKNVGLYGACIRAKEMLIL